MSEINSNSSVEETVSSATSSTSTITPPLSPDSLVCSTNSSCSSTENCSIHSSSTNNIQTNTTTTTSTTTNVCSHNNGQHNDLSGTTEQGLHNAFELLDIDSEHWKNQDEKIVDCLKSPVASRFELRVCGAAPSTPSTSPPLAGLGVADAMVSIPGEEHLTGCITSLQKLKLLCQECRKTESCKCSKIHLKKKISSSMLDKFNLARSSSSPRGVIKEARFRPHPSDSTEKSVLRASRLKFLSQLNAAKRAKHMASKSTPVKFDEANIFGQYSESYSNFSSLAQKASDNFHKMPPLGVGNNPNAPQFLVYQNNSSYDMLTNGLGVNRQPSLDLRLSASVGSNSNMVPFTIDQTCSLQARLDDMSVNELACYFEEYVHIPKKMSEMAEMMYR